jgi:hypothetical protein
METYCRFGLVLGLFVGSVCQVGCGGASQQPANDQTIVTVEKPSGSAGAQPPPPTTPAASPAPGK